MAENVSFTNNYMGYISNNPYIYPAINGDETLANQTGLNTGWHVMPLMLWRHFVTPAQWAKFVIDYEAYTVESFQMTLFNMIPMTTQLAIQGTSIFTSFNNTIYALGYSDKIYETAWHNWYQDEYMNPNLALKEGQYIVEAAGSAKKRYEFPIYTWQQPHVRVTDINTWSNAPIGNSGYGVFPMDQLSNNDGTYGTPSGIFWDPLNKPEELMEFRPGKNSMTFSGNMHECDQGKWFNLDQIMWWYPYVSYGPYHGNRPGAWRLSTECDPDRLSSQFQATPQINDYTMPNLAGQPVIPMNWMWKEIQQSIVTSGWQGTDKPDLFYPGTEYALAKYGFHQCFCKMVPLFDTNNTHVDITASVSVSVKLNLKAKKRRTAMYCPTWGPFNWKMLYSAHRKHLNFRPNFVRYRTGGARVPWQNFTGNGETSSGHFQSAHARETPYAATRNASGSGADNTRSALTTTTATPKPNITVTWSKDQDRVVIESQPKPPKRGIFSRRPATPEPTEVTGMQWDHITHPEK